MRCLRPIGASPPRLSLDAEGGELIAAGIRGTYVKIGKRQRLPIMINIRPYSPEDERAWLKCRVLSFLDTAYFDDVQPRKTVFENPVIDLVAVDGPLIVGLIEIECETAPGTVCWQKAGLGGMIWNILVHPDYRCQGIAAKLLDFAKKRAVERGILRFEACTRDDPWVLRWYEKNGWAHVMSYLHVYMDYEELQSEVQCRTPGLKPIKVFAHYTGAETLAIRKRFRRVHDCNLLELRF